MKKLYMLGLGLLGCCSASSVKAQFTYMGAFDNQGVPNYLVSPSDVISANLLSRIGTSLPEGYPVPQYNPQYITNTPSDLKLLAQADVWVTFVHEGAGYRNVLGYYTYPLSSPPTTRPAYADINIIFPNCSMPGSSGNLSRGSKVYLGNFPANTGIAFVCVADGWNGSAVDTGNWVLFSNPNFNPEPSDSLRRHNVLLYDTSLQAVVIGFEDIRREPSYHSDQDFNDLIYYCKATPGALDTTGIPTTTGPGDSTSTGGGGGLESESLCGAASLRDYNNIKNGVRIQTDYNQLPIFSMSNPLAKGTGSHLTELVPANLEAAYVPRVSSPTDLLHLTAAKDVLSVDYTLNNVNKAVVLAITTFDRPYNHTKSVCDRFRGSSLVSTDEITIKGIKFVRYLLKREDGDLEYSISFAAGAHVGDDTYNVQTNWLLSEYAVNDTVYNFQVWATQPHFSVKLVTDILNNLEASKKLAQVNTDFHLPKAFIINGKRVKENMVVTLNNYSTTREAKIVFEERLNENAGATNREVTLSLAQGGNNTVYIPIKDGYEYSGTLYLDGEKMDEVYFADGNWGIDYDAKNTKLDEFKPNNNETRVYEDDEYPVYRNVSLKATGADYVTVYKSIRSGFEKANLTAYHSVKFFARGNGKVNLYLTKESILKHKEQYNTTVTLEPNGKWYSISFDDFASTTKGAFDASDIKSAEFNFMMGGGTAQSVDFFVDNMSFSKEKVMATRGLDSKAIKLYPNPNQGQFSLQFKSEQDRVLTVTVTDIMGRMVYQQNIGAVTGANDVQITIPGATLPSMMYISVEGEGVKYETTRMGIK